MNKRMMAWSLGCCGAILACSIVANGQARNAPAQPATQPAVVSADAFPPGDPAIATTQMAVAMRAKKVTLSVTKMPVLTALEELSKQSGYAIKPGYNGMFRNKGANVTVSATDQPFWVVFRDICTRGNINVYNNGGDNTRAIQISPPNYGGGQIKASASIKGPFLTVVSNIERENSVVMSAPQNTNRSIHIQLQTFVEPRIVVSEASYEPIVDEAADENGNSMTPPPRDPRNTSMQGGRGIGWYGRVSLPYPTTNPGTRIAKLKGHVPARVQLSSEPVEIPDPLKATNVDKTVGGRRIILKSLTKVNDGYMLDLTVYMPEGSGPRDLNRLWNEAIGLHLTDAQGREVSFYNSGGSSANQESVTRQFTFNSTGAPPVKLVIDVPTGMQEISIPFELLNLPMP